MVRPYQKIHYKAPSFGEAGEAGEAGEQGG